MSGRKFSFEVTRPAARLPKRCSGSRRTAPTGRAGPSRSSFSRVGRGKVIRRRAASAPSAR